MLYVREKPPKLAFIEKSIFRNIVITLALFLGTNQSYSQDLIAENVCLQDLEKLTQNSKSLEDHTLNEMRDGLFTFAVLETPLVTSAQFMSLAEEAYAKINPKPQDEKEFDKEIKILKKDFSRNRKEYWKDLIRIKTGNDPRGFFKDYAAKDSAKMKELKETIAVKQNKRYEDLTRAVIPYAKLPYVTRVNLAETLWRDLFNFYSIPKPYEKLELDDVKTLTEKIKPWGISYTDYILLNNATRTIEKDPVLRRAMVGLISDVLDVIQPGVKADGQKFKDVAQYQKTIKEKKSVQSLEYSLKPPTITVISHADQTVLHTPDPKGENNVPAPESITLRTLVTERYPILFSDSYFYALGEVFKKEKINLEEFAKNYKVLSPPVREALVQEIWTEFKDYYFVSQLSNLTTADGMEVLKRATEMSLSSDDFLKNSYVIKVLDSDPNTKMAILQLIGDTLGEAIELTPHLQNALAWKKSRNTMSGKTSALLSAGLIAGFGASMHYVLGLNEATAIQHFGSTFLHASAIEIVPAVAASSGISIYKKIRESVARRKLNRGIDKIEAKLPEGDHENE